MKDIGKYFDIAFDSIREPIFVVDSGHQLVFGNAAFREFLKVAPKTSPQKVNLRDIWPTIEEELSPSSLTTYLTVGLDSIPVHLEISELAKDLFIVRVDAKQTPGAVLKEFHAQRVETLGMLAGGIAHDFNNILTGLLGHVTYLKTILPRSGNHTQSLSALEEGARKASVLTQEILNFSRADADEKPAKVELGDILQRTYNLLRGAISPEFEMSLSIPKEQVTALADEAKIAQVLVNLVMNSRDALKSGGKINIGLTVVDSEKELQSAFNGKKVSAKSYACISVEDEGHGMTPQVLERIFEPYFSTKRSKGTGLGLAIVREIVTIFAGGIKVESEVNKGTKISVYLPLIEGVGSAVRAPQQQEVLEGGKERILVVDDEYPVRNVLSLSLEHLGYEVEIASSGAEALEKYGSEGQRFDLVILDMLMPNLSGDETFFRLKQIDPEVRVLVISGYTSEEVVQNILDNGGRGFVQKPFTINELAKRVRECFDEEL